MSEQKKTERKYDFIIDMFGKEVTKYDLPFLASIMQPGIEISPEEVDARYGSRKDLLQDCYERDPKKVSDYLVRKGAILLHSAYDHYRALVLDEGMEENDPKKVKELLKDWKVLKEHVAADRIILDDRRIPSCIIDTRDIGKKRLTFVEELEKHLRSISK